MTDEPAACPMPDRTLDDEVRKILGSMKRIAVVGMSSNPERPSREVGFYLKSRGFEILPVHPKEREIEGIEVYSSLREIPAEKRPQIVDIFVAGERTGPVVEAAAEIGAEVLWFQPGAESPESEKRGRELGLRVVSGVCTMAEHKRLFGTS